MDFHSDSDPIADSDEEIVSSDEEKELERALADIPFEELQRARADGSHSARLKPPRQQKLARANKNRPMEMSSKSRVGRYREVIQAPKKVVRDPRFESLSGAVDTDGFRKRYNFLFETELPAEKEKLQKLIKKSKDQKVIGELKEHISWILSSKSTMESNIAMEPSHIVNTEKGYPSKQHEPTMTKSHKIGPSKVLKHVSLVEEDAKDTTHVEASEEFMQDLEADVLASMKIFHEQARVLHTMVQFKEQDEANVICQATAIEVLQDNI